MFDYLFVDIAQNACNGKLPYCSTDFKFQTLDEKTFQRTGTINYSNDYNFNLIFEFKCLTGQKHKKTTGVYEFPKSPRDRYYQTPRSENNELYKKYQLLASQCETKFVGQLSSYIYCNTEHLVAQGPSVCKILKLGYHLNLNRDSIANKSIITND